VSPRGHSTKTTLLSAPDLALGKAYFKIKKNLCRVPDHGHSAKHSYIAPGQFFFFLTLSLSHSAVPSASRRRRALGRHRAPAAPAAVPSLPATSPSARRALPARDLACRRALPALAGPLRSRALARPPRRPSRTRPPAAKVHAGKVHRVLLSRPRPAVSPATKPQRWLLAFVL
jgi:hypothetical protein